MPVETPWRGTPRSPLFLLETPYRHVKIEISGLLRAAIKRVTGSSPVFPPPVLAITSTFALLQAGSRRKRDELAVGESQQEKAVVT